MVVPLASDKPQSTRMQESSIGTQCSDPVEKLGESAIKRQWIAVRVFWVCLFLGLAAFVIIANVVGSTAPSSTELDQGSHIVYALSILVALLLLLSRIQSRIAADLDPLIGRLLRLVFTGPVPPGKVKRPTPSSWIGMIWIGLLCEAIALLGLVFFLAGGSYPWLYVAATIAAVALVYLRPRKQDITAAAVKLDTPPYRLMALRSLAPFFALVLAICLVLVALGFAFCLLAVGLMPGIAILMLVVRDKQATLKLFGPPYYRHTWLVTRVLLPVGLGIYFLAQWGFCGQNFICMLLR